MKFFPSCEVFFKIDKLFSKLMNLFQICEKNKIDELFGNLVIFFSNLIWTFWKFINFFVKFMKKIQIKELLSISWTFLKLVDFFVKIVKFFQIDELFLIS